MPSKKIQTTIIIILSHCLYLLVITRANTYFTPCLQPKPGASYASDNCLTTQVLDRFIYLALAGFVISSLAIFVSFGKKSLKLIIIGLLSLGIITVAAYYLYLPHALNQVNRAPINLDSSSF